jgi:hypothetical protein
MTNIAAKIFIGMHGLKRLQRKGYKYFVERSVEERRVTNSVALVGAEKNNKTTKQQPVVCFLQSGHH